MTWTLPDVKNIVDGYITGTALSLSSKNNSLASTSLNALLDSCWGGTLTGTVIPAGGQNGVITGNDLVYTVSLNTNGFLLYQHAPTVPGKLDFTINNNNVELQVTVSPDGNYAFADSFPVLSNTPTITLNQVAMTGCSLLLNSQQAGITGFQATLVVNDLFDLVSWILGSAPQLQGGIQLQQANGQEYPQLILRTPDLAPLDFGIFKLDLYLTLQSALTLFPGKDPAFAFAGQVSLLTEFTAGGFSLPVAMGIYGPGQSLVSFDLDRNRTVPPVTDLSNLGGFMGTNDPKSLITVPLPWNNASFSIDTASVVFDIISKSLVSLEIGVSLSLSWSVIPGVIELQKIGALFTIDDPMQPQVSNVHVLLYADMKLGPVFLETSINLPDGALSAGLQEGTTVDVNDLIGTFAKGVTLPGNDQLTIYTLSFFAQVTGDLSYSFEAEAGGQLTIINGLVIDNIAFLMAYDNGALSDVRFGSQLTLTQCGVDIYLQAEYKQNNGWDFSGSTGEGQQIPIGHFVADLVSLFGIDSVPEWLNGATVQDISASFNSLQGNFNFGITGTIPLVEDNLVITLNFALTKKDNSNSYTKLITGKIQIAGMLFTLVLDSDDTINAFIATYQPAAGSPSSIPLKQLVSGLSSSVGALIPDGIAVDLKSAKFVFLSQNSVTRWAVGVDLGLSFNLSNLPIIGDKLPKELSIGVDSLQILYCNDVFTDTQAGIVNPLLPSGVSPLLAKGTVQGIQVSGNLNIAGVPEVLAIGTGSSSGSQNNAGNLAVAAAAPGDPVAAAAAPGDPAVPAPTIKWFNIQKQFGPVQFQRIGISFSDNILAFSLDASIMLGPVTFSMEGLTFGSSISSFAPDFDLQGLGLSYTSPAVTVEGSILKIPKGQLASGVEFQYDGMVAVKAGTWGLTALASYAQLSNGVPSLFVFAELNATLGGPPFFIVTGLMGGFGFNRSLQLPSFDEVADFPLLAIGAPGSSDPLTVLAIMEGRQAGVSGKTKKWIEPEAGQYWLAAGLSFASFEIVQGELLLVAEFGQDLQFALLGLAWMSLPQNASKDNTYVYVELQLAAVLKPSEGFFSIAAALTNNSYVISKDCHLTGGFAFCFWFSPNTNAGQFVVTIGGYHPAFSPPSYYPKVPRLGFNWVVGSTVTITGGAYFAITPSCGMAGGSLAVVFSSGDLRAWFTAQADMMITWNPFSFYAYIGVEIGVSYRLNLLVCHKTISISLGADMTLWGPPTGGRVTIHVVVVSFTVSFGSDDPMNKMNQPLVWNDFKPLLPAPADICKITASTGVFKTLDSSNGPSNGVGADVNASKPKIWVVRSGGFSFFTQTAIPSSVLSYSSGSKTVESKVAAQGINIRPMNQTGVASNHLMQLFFENDTSPQDLTGWSINAGNTNMPETLWGQPLKDGNGNFVQSPTTPSAAVVADQLTGYTVVAPLPALGAVTGLVAIEELREEYILPSNGTIPQNPLSSAVTPTTDFAPAPAAGSVADIASTIAAAGGGARGSIFSLLQTNKIYSGTNSNMSVMASDAGNLFSDPPMERA